METTLVARCPVCRAETSMQTCMGGMAGDLRTQKLGCAHAVQFRFGTVFFSTVVFQTPDGRIQTVAANPKVR